MLEQSDKLSSQSDLRARSEIPEVVSIDRDDQAVSSSHGTLRVDTEGGVGVWGGQEKKLEKLINEIFTAALPMKTVRPTPLCWHF